MERHHQSVHKLCVLMLSVVAGVPLLVNAQTAPQRMTLQGRILKSDDSPVENSSVTFTLQVRSPGVENCLLFEETQTVNMTGSAGVFSLAFGGTRAGTDYQYTSTLAQVFSNASGTINSLTCAMGTSYAPASGDRRKMRLMFDDGSGVQTMAQDLLLQSVPYALYADSLQGKAPTDFIQANVTGAALSQANVEAVFSSTAAVNELIALMNGTSTHYTSSSAGNFTPAADLNFNSKKITNLADPSQPQDAATKTYADTRIGGASADSATLSTLASGDNGKVLTWNGTKWVAQSAGDASRVAKTGDTMTGSLTLNNADLALSGTSKVTGQMSVSRTGLNGSGSSNILNLASDAKTANDEVGMNFTMQNASNASTAYSMIYSGVKSPTASSETGYLRFLTKNSTGMSEAMRIDSQGYVGIGRTSPTYPLEVASTVERVISATSNNVFGTHIQFSNTSSSSAWSWATTGSTSWNGIPAGSAVLDQSSVYPRIVVTPTGLIGVATMDPEVGLDLSGVEDALRLPAGTTAQRPSYPAAGDIRWNTTSSVLEYHNGSTWVAVGTAGSGLTSLNGLTGGTQTFAVGSSGTAPLFSSSGTAHTLNIPLASASSVTAGLISKTDYDSFNSKLGASSTFSGDVSGTYGAMSVDKIKGKAVTAPTLAGQVLRYDGTAITPNFVAMTDLRSKVTGTQALSATCTAAQTLTYNTATDSLACSNIAIDGNQISAGTLSAARLPASVVLSGGNAFGATANIGTTDSHDLHLVTDGTPRVSILANGNVGIGNANPWTDFVMEKEDIGVNLVVQNNSSTAARWPGMSIYNYTSSMGGNPLIEMGNARGSSSSPGAIQEGDWLAAITAAGYGSSSWQTNVGQIIFSADDDFADGDTPTSIAFTTAPSGSSTAEERMRITSSGRVGIGTSAPDSPLHVGPGEGLSYNGDYGTGVPDINVSNTSGEAGVGVVIRDGTNNRRAKLFVDQTNAVWGLKGDYSTGGIPFVITQSEIEVFRITSAGSVGIGLTSPSDKLQVSGDVRVGTSGSNGCVKNRAGTGLTGTCSSDERLKKNIEPMVNVAEALAKVKPAHYEWRVEEFPERHFGPGQQLGVIAQQVQSVIPELVEQDEDGYLKVKYQDFTMYLIKGFSEHHAKLKEVSARCEMTDYQMGELEQRVARLAESDRLQANDIARLKTENALLKADNARMHRDLAAIKKHLGL